MGVSFSGDTVFVGLVGGSGFGSSEELLVSLLGVVMAGVEELVACSSLLFPS